MGVKGSQTGGVKPMSISGRFNTERERLAGMTDAERAFRKQWLKDQELSHNEPKHVPELYKATHNPIRRFYRWPLNQLQKVLTPALGAQRALTVRYLSGKVLLGITAMYFATYYYKYNSNDWTRKGGWRINSSRSAIVEGDPGYPSVSTKTKGSDYAQRGYENVTLKL